MGSCLDRCLSWSGRTNSYSSPSGRMSPLSPSSSPWVQGAATPINLEENICTGSISKQQWQWLHSPPMKRSYTCTVYIYIEYTWIYHNMPIIYYIPRTGRRWPRFRSKTKVTQALGVCVFIYIYLWFHMYTKSSKCQSITNSLQLSGYSSDVHHWVRDSSEALVVLVVSKFSCSFASRDRCGGRSRLKDRDSFTIIDSSKNNTICSKMKEMSKNSM